MKNYIFPEDDDLQYYRRHRIPDKKVINVYRQLKRWKLFMVLSHGEIRTVRDLIETHYPMVQQEAKKLRKARWEGIFNGIVTTILILILILLISGALQ